MQADPQFPGGGVAGAQSFSHCPSGQWQKQQETLSLP